MAVMTVSPCCERRRRERSHGQPGCGHQGAGPVRRLGVDRTRGGLARASASPMPAAEIAGKKPTSPISRGRSKRRCPRSRRREPNPQFDETTDPQVIYCEPPGVPHIYLWPAKTKFIQTPEAVYILHEIGPFYRVVWLNSQTSGRAGSAVVGAFDRPLRERRHPGRGHGRLQRQDVAGSDGPSPNGQDAPDRALQADQREANGPRHGDR